MSLLVEKNHDRRAVNFLVDDALSHGRTEAAIGLLEDWLKDIQPQENLVTRLAEIYQNQKQWAALDKLMDRLLKVYPESQYAWVLKAVAAMSEKRFADAERSARKVIAINPNNMDGHETLAEALGAQGRAREALSEMEIFLSLNPTNPPGVVKYAQALYDAHEEGRAKEFLKKWLKENKDSAVLPIFLYHGLTSFPKDPMLSYPFHHYVGVFEDHIRALHDEGYTPVTIEQVNAWLTQGKPLPPRPVLISFDDGRTDSFVLADPILQKYGFKATMMSALVNVEGYPTPDPPPGFASWERIKGFRDTGRWEIQGHGDIAHIHIPISSAGVQGMFLVNREWLDSAGRLETVEEWTARIDHDYQGAQQKMLAHLGAAPTGFAYPEGSYGQMDDNCNVPESAPVNQALVKKYYQTAYVQDSIGLNLRSQDRGRMNRVEPNNAWTGTDLIRHIQDENPISKAYEQFVDWASWEGHTREAYVWLDEMKAGGASDGIVAAEEAQIRLYAGDFAGGQAQAQQILSAGTFPGLETTLRTENLRAGVSWNPSYTFQNDNEGRRAWQLNQNLFFPKRGNLQLYAVERHAEYTETGSPLVVDNAVGAGADLNLGLYQQLGLTLLQHLFTAAEPTVSAAGKVDSRWTDLLSTEFEVGYTPLANALALSHNILGTYGAASGRWDPDEHWKLTLREDWTVYTDSNRRTTTDAEADRVLYTGDRFVVKGIDRLTYDDTRAFSLNYYSPQRLWLDALGPELTYRFNRRAQLILRDLPGYSSEAGFSSQFVNEAEAAVEFRWNDVNSVRPSYTYYDTPTYRSNTYAIELTQHF
jgi:peptidoglycan/xylan/chitin deacetylase (PgdA/CDA1 family)